jgi:hypothetical protein
MAARNLASGWQVLPNGGVDVGYGAAGQCDSARHAVYADFVRDLSLLAEV